MKKKLNKLTGVLLATAMAATTLMGCGASDTPDASSQPAANVQSSAPAAQTGSSEAAPATNDKPYEGVKLTWWVKLNANVSSQYPNWGDTPFIKYIEEQTGIDIEFIHPTVGSESEEFAILMAGGEFPDIIQHTWTKYSGGPVAAINDGVIISLDDVMANSAPNLNALIDKNPEIGRSIKTSDGQYYCFPFLRGTESPNVTQFSSGFMLRKDILDELKLEMPETVAEWEVVLRAFKEKGFEKPFITRGEWMMDVWSPGFDNWGDFYVEDGVVKHGLIEDSRKELVTKLHQWYEEGLIDKDYLVAQKKDNQTDFTTEKAAAVYAPFGQGLGTYTKVMNEANPEITEEDIRSCVPVTSVKGQNAKFSKMNQIYDASGSSAAITTDCKNVEAAAWLLDWLYSEEGFICNNFGIEGVSYEMVNGEPVYTDLIMKNPDGLDVSVALAIYTGASSSSVGVQDPRYIEQYYVQNNQKEALANSMKTDMGSHFFPPTSVADEDSEKFAEIMNNVNTAADEMEAQFIAGTVPLSDWDKHIDQLKKFGIEEAIKMMQKAYDAYMSN